jgi:hypothetical protein
LLTICLLKINQQSELLKSYIFDLFKLDEIISNNIGSDFSQQQNLKNKKNKEESK